MRAEEYFEALRTSPLVTVSELTRDRAFVVLSPHPDDETLGMGGLIAAACAENLEADVIIVTDGSGSHPLSKTYPRQRLIETRYSEVKKAGLALGLTSNRLKFFGLPDTRLPRSGPAFDEAVNETLNVIRSSDAASLFVTWEFDPHCDHQAAAELARTVRRRSPGLKLWAYPIWGWHLDPDFPTGQPTPQAFRIDISRFQNRKRAAINAHASQMTGLIDDDPTGFRFDDILIAPFMGQYEYFIEVPD